MLNEPMTLDKSNKKTVESRHGNRYQIEVLLEEGNLPGLPRLPT